MNLCSGFQQERLVRRSKYTRTWVLVFCRRRSCSAMALSMPFLASSGAFITDLCHCDLVLLISPTLALQQNTSNTVTELRIHGQSSFSIGMFPTPPVRGKQAEGQRRRKP